ncbi:ABC-type transport system involved in resistance to organic solvents, permease component [Burkholderiales bacterium JOSHI_001]|nr:ABC-type transport system involved in resistance to organic solvents, permease component [Burkholderiales bacterium JOSHI_001]
MATPPLTPTLHVARQGDALHVALGGHWSLHGAAADLGPAQAALADLPAPGGRLVLATEGLAQWDSYAVTALWLLRSQAQARALAVETSALPVDLQRVLALAQTRPAPAPADAPRLPWLQRLGHVALAPWTGAQTTLGFVGEVVLALGRAARGRSRMRAADLWFQVDQCGPRSLPIVGLISFLVGLILAYMGAAQLQRFGAQIYIADLVTIGMVREIAALMTAIILAGRVGAAFAAQLGSMQANEEIDALHALGLPPVEHLVLPRLLALTLVAPLLTAYAGAVGVVAGLLVAVGVFHVTPVEYVRQSLEALTLTHAAVGLFKGTVYAALVAISGCLQGLNAGRSAQAVGEATTRAVVQAIVWIVVSASAITVALQRLDW